MALRLRFERLTSSKPICRFPISRNSNSELALNWFDFDYLILLEIVEVPSQGRVCRRLDRSPVSQNWFLAIDLIDKRRHVLTLGPRLGFCLTL